MTVRDRIIIVRINLEPLDQINTSWLIHVHIIIVLFKLTLLVLNHMDHVYEMKKKKKKIVLEIPSG